VWIAGIALLLTISIIGISSQEAFAGLVPPAQVTLEKSVDKPIVVSGTTVEYSYKIKNTGQNDIFCGAVVDDNGTPGTGDDHTIIVNVLLLGFPDNEETTVMNSVVITGTEDVTNNAVVNCVDDAGALTGEASTDVDVVNPAATLLKTPKKTQVINGQQITYDFKATRAGDIRLNNCVITDGTIVFVGASHNLVNNGDMTNPVQTSALVTINDPGLTNTASMICDVPTTMGDTITVMSNEVIVTTVDISGLELAKTPKKTQVVDGQQITYDLEATNNGSFDLLNCQINDPLVGGDIGGTFPLAKDGGTHKETTGLITITGAGLDNTAKVTCNEPITMNDVSAEGSASVTVVNIGGLELVKTVNDQDCSDPENPVMVPEGTDVTFMFKATNTNLNFMYMDCQINDPMLGGNLGATFNLAAEGGMNTDVTEVVTINADMWNTATIECMEDVTMQDVMATSNVCHVEIQDMPCVDLQKMVTPSLIEQGETVKYIYDVINCGDVALTNCNINDDNGTPVNTNDDFPVGDVDFSIPVGNSIPLPFEIMKQISMDTKNTATVICTAGQQPVEDMDMARVTILVVGGEFLSIDTTALFLGGIQSSAVWILPTVAGLAGAGYYLVKFRNKEE